jgi:hypothetical protein
VEFAIPFGRKTELMNKDMLAKMKNTRTNKYALLVMILRSGFEAKSNAAIEFKVEYRSFIVSSLGAIPGETISVFKSIVGKCPIFVMNLWMKRMVCDVLKGNWLIWIGGKENIYNMMRQRVTLEKFDKREVKYAQEGKVETKDWWALRPSLPVLVAFCLLMNRG